MRSSRFASGTLLLIAGMIIGALLTMREYARYRLDDMRQVLSTIEDYYIKRTDPDELYRGAARAVARSLDRYSDYLSSKEWESYEAELTGKYEGVGVTIGRDKGNMHRIFVVHEGSPAEKAGLQAGDILLKVDGKDASAFTIAQLSALLRGESGSDVRVIIQRGDATLEKTVTRGRVEYVPIVAKMAGKDIGYVQVASFSNIKAHIDDKLQGLYAHGARSFIIDVRYNLGGLLDEAVALCDTFLGDAVAVTVESRLRRMNKVHKTSQNSRWEGVPIAVLVNHQSASASEIFAGAIQDNKRGWIIGTKTYGKGVVQGTFQVGNGDRLKLTVAIYRTPSGRHIHRFNGGQDYGISPDVEVKTDKEVEKQIAQFLAALETQSGLEMQVPDYDVQLKKAIEVLNARAK